MSDRFTSEIAAEKGRGRATVVISDAAEEATARALFEQLDSERHTMLVRLPAAALLEWQAASRALLGMLKGRGIRQASFVSFGRASETVLSCCLEESRAVRSVLLCNGTARLGEHWLDDMLERLETALPMGLPFRTRVKGFDARPFLQRIRCPVLIALSGEASSVVTRQAALLAGSIPTSWLLRISDSGLAESLASLIQDFEQVPARCPQKNR